MRKLSIMEMWKWASVWVALYFGILTMDANDLLLMYMPYCVYKKITVCLDEAIKKHPEFLSQHKGKDNSEFFMFIIL